MRRHSYLTVILAGLLAAAEPPREPILVEQPDAFKTLINPACSHCKDEAKRRSGELKDDDRVLCWIREKYDASSAIPTASSCSMPTRVSRAALRRRSMSRSTAGATASW